MSLLSLLSDGISSVHLHAGAENISGLQIFVGRELEKRGLEAAIVDLVLVGEDVLVDIGAADPADEIVKALEVINVFHFALHRDPGLVDHRRAELTGRPGKGLGFVCLVAAQTAHAVGLLQPGGVHHIDRDDLVLPDTLIRIVGFYHGKHQMAVGHDARVRDQRPVRLAVDHRADHNDGGGVQRELRAFFKNIFFGKRKRPSGGRPFLLAERGAGNIIPCESACGTVRAYSLSCRGSTG